MKTEAGCADIHSGAGFGFDFLSCRKARSVSLYDYSFMMQNRFVDLSNIGSNIQGWLGLRRA